MGEPITRNAYLILGVAPGSDDAMIATAYKALARRLHPDIAGEGATGRMIRLNVAFAQIRTSELRDEYDRALARDGGTIRPRQPEPDGTAAAGPPPGRPSGSVLGFGRHLGWSIGEIARTDPGYLVWLEERAEGKPYLAEIDRTLRAFGFRIDRKPPRTRRR